MLSLALTMLIFIGLEHLFSLFPVKDSFPSGIIAFLLSLPFAFLIMKLFQGWIAYAEREKEKERESLKHKVRIHHKALRLNMDKALVYNDYGRVVSNKQNIVIEDFLESVGYQKHLLTKKDARNIVLKIMSKKL